MSEENESIETYLELPWVLFGYIAEEYASQTKYLSTDRGVETYGAIIDLGKTLAAMLYRGNDKDYSVVEVYPLTVTALVGAAREAQSPF